VDSRINLNCPRHFDAAYAEAQVRLARSLPPPPAPMAEVERELAMALAGERFAEATRNWRTPACSKQR
jgi:hypothetical protein